MDRSRWTALLVNWSDGPGPLYARLARALQEAVSAGRLTPGERLPSERQLSDLLQLSRSTVVTAYEELAAEGWVQRRQGSGTRVADHAPRQANVLALRSPVRGDVDTPGELDLTIAVPHLTPPQQVRLAQAGTGSFTDPQYHPLGWPPLRALLAEQYTHTGLPTRPEQIIVTTGAQQAISLVTGALLRPGDHALLETPTYFGAIDVLRAAGARLLGVPVTPDGVPPAEFQALARQGARLAFLTPSFQNPTGTVVPALSRERLAQTIRHLALPTIEDDTLIDLGLDADPPPRLAAFAPDAPIVNVGSLGKLFWAGLRVGWLRAPHDLLPPLLQAKTLADFGSSLPSQMIALKLLQDLPDLKAQRRADILPARDRLVTLLREHLPEWAFTVPTGGQFLWVELPTRNVTGFTHLARRHGVRLFPGATMDVTDLPDRYLRLPFTVPEDQLEVAVKRLRGAWEAFRTREPERLA